MLKFIRRPLELIFNDCLANGIFPSDLKKKVNIIAVHKKNDKQCLIFNEMFGFFIENEVTSQQQFHFKSGNNQLISIT